MTGQPFLRSLLGASATIAVEAAFGADLSDLIGAGWVWTDVTADAKHDVGIPVTLGRTDNVGQAGAARIGAQLENGTGNYTVGNVSSAYAGQIKQNTPVRQRMTLDGVTWFTRFQGYLDTLNPTTDQSAKVKRVALVALGALGRIGGLKKPLRSALYRAIIPSGPTAYWPLEDAAGSTVAASAVDRVGVLIKQPGTVGLPTFGGIGPGGAAAAIDFPAGISGLQVNTLPPSSATSWRYECSVLCPDTDAYSMGIGFDMQGGISDISLQITSAGLTVHTEFADGVTTPRNDASSLNTNDGVWHRLRFEVAKSGADTTYVLKIDGNTGLSITLAGVTFGHPWTMSIGGSAGSLSPGSRMAATSATLWQPYAPPVATNTLAANDGWTGETANARLTRLCAELGIALDLSGTSSATMGPQSVDTVLNLLRECEAADHGVLYDGVGPGIAYQCRSARYGAPAALTLDMGAATPEVNQLAPVFDKQAIKNVYGVSRKGGGTVTVEDVTGPLGTDTIGVEDAAVTLNIDSDTPLVDHGNWLVALGTIDGFRYPGIVLNMLSIPGKALGVLGLTPGDRVTIVNPAAKSVDLPPDPVDLIVEGWTETTTADTWSLALNTSPYQASRVFIVEDAAFGRIDSDDTVVSGGLAANATAITVAPGIPSEWTVAAADFPFDLDVGGERVTAVDGANGTSAISQDGTFEVTDTTAWSKTSCTLVTDNAHVIAGLDISAKLVTVGTPTQAFARMPNVVSPIVVPGDLYTAQMWMFSVGGYGTAQATIDWLNSSGGFISTSNVTVALAPNTWQRVRVLNAVAPALAARAQVGPTLGGSPPAGTTIWVAAVTFTHRVGADGSTQTFTVRRGAGAAHIFNGARAKLWRPGVIAL